MHSSLILNQLPGNQYRNSPTSIDHLLNLDKVLILHLDILNHFIHFHDKEQVLRLMARGKLPLWLLKDLTSFVF